MIKFWEEKEGEQSATRLVFLGMTVYAMAMGAIVWFQTQDWVAVMTLVGSLFSLGAGAKLFQKPMEDKTP